MKLFSRARGLSGAERDRLAADAVRLQREMTPDDRVVAALQEQGAPPPVAAEINLQARARVDREVAASVRLPASSRREINYYFLLGVTPVAAADQIHRAYRRKAKDVHPDRHGSEFVIDQWQDLMTVVADASDVLTDPRKRRAYDVFWRDRSHSVAMRYRKKGEQRGDLETRYLWEIAAMAELEDAISLRLNELEGELRDGADVTTAAVALCRALEEYEGRMIEIRTDTYGFPDHLAGFSDRVRAEMQRKERLVRALRQLLPRTPDRVAAADRAQMAALVDSVNLVLEEIRRAQSQFELGTARPFI